MSTTSDVNYQESIRETVREGYRKVAEGEESCCTPHKSCCGDGGAELLAEKLGYDQGELASLPDGANMGLSCGNPTALAALQPGEVVVDLGSGGGFDIFLAGQKVGVEGRAIGVDMTHEMLQKARKNTVSYNERTGLDNVEFRLGEIEHLPIADNSVDVIISNCVINLSPDKPQVWSEIFRVLKPGGRVAASDIALYQVLPQEVIDMAAARIGCVAGAILVSDTEAILQGLGFTNIALTPNPAYIDTMVETDDPLYETLATLLPEGVSLNEVVTSLGIEAKKPCGCSCGC